MISTVFNQKLQAKYNFMYLCNCMWKHIYTLIHTHTHTHTHTHRYIYTYIHIYIYIYIYIYMHYIYVYILSGLGMTHTNQQKGDLDGRWKACPEVKQRGLISPTQKFQ